MFTKRMGQFSVLMGSLLLMFIAVTVMAALPDHTEITEQEVTWKTYRDPRFDFSISYPVDWHVIPRDDTDLAALSGLLIFIPPGLVEQEEPTAENYNPHQEIPKIVIGLYLAELENNQSLDQWTQQYEATSNHFDESLMRRQSRKVIKVNKANAVWEEGVSH